MAITTVSFGDQVAQFSEKAKDLFLAARNEAAEDIGDKLREYTPVDHGFLRGTIQTSINEPTPIDPDKMNAGKATYSGTVGETSLVIANAGIDDVIYHCFTMGYAPFVEYGTSKMAPRAMVRRTVAEWPQVVSAAAARVRARAGQAGR